MQSQIAYLIQLISIENEKHNETKEKLKRASLEKGNYSVETNNKSEDLSERVIQLEKELQAKQKQVDDAIKEK